MFKQLDKEGKKPKFMLRKQAPVADGQPTNIYPGAGPAGPNSGFSTPATGGLGPPSINTNLDNASAVGVQAAGGGGGTTASRSQAPQIGSIQLPGGVL